MTSHIFANEICKWDVKLRNRKILLVIDNCAAHPTINNLGNIKIVFLPSNITAVLQPMNQGIIKCLKQNFRKMLVLQLIDNVKKGKKKFNTNFLEAIRLINRSWNIVSQTTTKNCFIYAGFIDRENEIEF